MKMQFKATNISVTPEVTDYLQKRLDTLDKFIDSDPDSVYCEVELAKTTNHHKSGDVFKAEINFQKNGKLFRSVSKKENLNAAIDEAKDEIARELASHKSKQKTLIRKGGAMIKNMLRGFRR